MKTISVSVFKFSELGEKAKQKARNWWINISSGDDWWQDTFEDCKQIGLEIHSFDIDRNKCARGKFLDGAFSCAHKVVDSHGPNCATYKTAQDYLRQYAALMAGKSIDQDGNVAIGQELQEDIDFIGQEFLRLLLSDYSDILQKEYEFRLNKESIDEILTVNEYDFLADGSRFDLFL